MTFHTNDIRHILEAARSKMDFIPGVDDLIPICSAMLSDSATSSEPWQYQIPDPNTSHKGVLSSPDAFAIFRRRLEKLVNNRATEQRKKILNCLMSITEQSSGLWESPDLWDAWIKDPVYEKRRLAKTCKNVVQGYVNLMSSRQSLIVDVDTILKQPHIFKIVKSTIATW